MPTTTTTTFFQVGTESDVLSCWLGISQTALTELGKALVLPVVCRYHCAQLAEQENSVRHKQNTETNMISGCAYKLREVQYRCSDNQGDGGRRRGVGLSVLQLTHLSSPVLFCACFLNQGPYRSGETDIQQVSRWLTLS